MPPKKGRKPKYQVLEDSETESNSSPNINLGKKRKQPEEEAKLPGQTPSAAAFLEQKGETVDRMLKEKASYGFKNAEWVRKREAQKNRGHAKFVKNLK